MKQIFLFSFFIFSFSFSKAQWVTIPDANFVAWLQTNYPSCMNGNLMDTTSSVLINATTITFPTGTISDLTGIQYFDSLLILNCHNNSILNIPALPSLLITLDCSFNSLTNLPALPNTLHNLYCYNNSLTSLPPLPASLLQIDCSNNLLTSLPVLPNSLTYLNCANDSLISLPLLSNSLHNLSCQHNLLTSIPTLPSVLEDLFCYYNSLTSLPILPSSLIHLDCYNNSLTSLPALPNSLVELYCNSNSLTNLPTLPNSLVSIECNYNSLANLPGLSSSLIHLNCEHNLLTSLPTLPNSLGNLYCKNNFLTSLPVLPNSLTFLNCSYNSLTSLPALPNLLGGLICSHNSLTSLPLLPTTMSIFQIEDNPSITCMPFLQSFTLGSNYFNISNTSITCLPNIIQHSQFPVIPAIDTMPICDLFNQNGCTVFWNISGTVFQDGDSSCTTTNDGTPIASLKMNLKNGAGNLVQQIIGNWGGEYSFYTQLGDYFTSVDTVNIPFNVLCPSNNSISSNLTVIDSMDYNIDFRLTCKPGFDIGALNIYRTHRFFPDDTTLVRFIAGDIIQSIYNASCNSGISGEVKIVINGPVNYVSPLAGTLTPTVNGDTLTYSIANFSLINAATDFAFYVLTDSTAQIGDVICFDVSVTPTAGDNNISNNTLTHCFAVSNSFDPNEKEVSPIGDLNYPFNNWLSYTIHFQNTGTAPAQHIQILDTLDSDLDESTFQLLSSSFDPMVQLFGNKVHFNFININLPDSTTDAEGSKGYVSYRIKPKQNLAIGTQIENTASIYFDFNSPVVTNTTLNTIVHDNGVQQLTMDNGQLIIYPNPVSSQLTVGSVQLAGATLTVTDIFGREVLSVKPSRSNGTQIINLKSLPSGIYFLKVLFEDGNFAVKKIVKE